MPGAAFWRLWSMQAWPAAQGALGARMTVRILRWATGCVAAVSVALLVGGVALSYVDRHMGPLSRWDFSNVFEEATFIAVPAVGFVLASRRPGNRVGWIFLGAGLVLGLGFFCDRYGRGGLVAAPGSLPAARAAAWFVNWAWVIPTAGLAFMLLLFPTGRLRSRRWRPAAWFVAAVFTLDAAAQVVRACRVWADPFTGLSDGWYRGSHTAVFILVPAALLVGGAAVTVRFARSSGEERLQLKWFAMAAVLVVATIIPLGISPQIGLSPAVASAALSTLKVVFCLALVCLYVAIAVAVLKYRLYDIDRSSPGRWPTRSSPACWRGSMPGWCCWLPRCSACTPRWRWPPPPWPRRPCSARCGAGCSGGWTGGSTGPGMTATRPWPCLRPG